MGPNDHQSGLSTPAGAKPAKSPTIRGVHSEKMSDFLSGVPILHLILRDTVVTNPSVMERQINCDHFGGTGRQYVSKRQVTPCSNPRVGYGCSVIGAHCPHY